MKINERIPAGEQFEITAGDVGSLDVEEKRQPIPGFVCKACGLSLKDRACTDAPDCDGHGPHVPLLIDTATAVIGRDGRCIRAVHLE